MAEAAMSRARGGVVIIAAPGSLRMREISDTMNVVSAHLPDDVALVFGTRDSTTTTDSLKVSVALAGIA
jgi:cell division GTPase FtsZ